MAVPTADYLRSVQSWAPKESHHWKPAESGFDPFAPPERVAAEGPVAPEKDKARAIELLAIRPEPFPVRLIGIVGHGAGCHGVFEIMSDGQIVLARAGETIGREGLRIESVHARGITPKALVQDIASNRVMELAAGSPAVSGEWIASIRDANGVHDVRAGAGLASGQDRYRIESIAKASVVLVREGVDGSTAERRELRVAAEDAQ